MLHDQNTDADLLLAAVDATVNINHHDAMETLNELLDRSFDNDDIVDAVDEALAMLDELF